MLLNKKKAKYNLGYALCGGGAKGFSHLGAIKLLEEKGLKPDIIAGTSAGALAGVFYADGYTPDEIIDMFKGKAFKQFAAFASPKTGLFKSIGLSQFLKKNLHAKTFEQLQIPFVAVTTNWETATIKEFRKGDTLVDAVVASCTVPMVFQPQKIDGVLYVDGGVLKNFPVSCIRKECEYIIGMNLSRVNAFNGTNHLWQVALRYFNISASLNVLGDKELCDILVDMEGLAKYNMFDLNNIDALYELGYKNMQRVLKTDKSKEVIEKIKTIDETPLEMIKKKFFDK